jgi:hypothetical protein
MLFILWAQEKRRARERIGGELAVVMGSAE